MTQNVNTLGVLTAENKTFYERALLKRLLPALHSYTDAQKSSLPKNSGTTVNWRKFTKLAKTGTTLSEGVTPDGKSLAVSTVTATAAQYGDYIVISDLLAKSGMDKAMTEGSILCGEQAAEIIDDVIMQAMTDGATSYIAGGKTEASLAAADILTEADIKKIVRALKRKNARKFPDGYYHAIIHPDVSFDIMGMTGWLDAAKYGDIKQLLKGELGRLHGIRFMESTNCKTKNVGAAGSKIDACVSLVYGADSYGVIDMENGAGKPDIITKDFGSSGTDDPLNQRASVGWKNLFVAKVLDPDAIIKTISATTV